MSSGSSDVRRFEADFKKVAGVLSITSSAIAWVPKLAGSMDRQNQALNRVMAMFASKATSPRISLKITFKDDIPTGGLLFTFNSSSAAADRQTVQDILIPYITANRAGAAPGAGTATPTAAGPSTPTSMGTPGTPGPSSVVNKGKRKAEDDAGGAAGAAKLKAMNRLRLRVLNKTPNLKLLHRELVVGKQITEEEFWEGREALLQAEEMAYAQRPGRASRLLDDRFDLDSGKKATTGFGGTGVGVKSKADSGPVVLNLSKELTREIFEEFPVVQDAYARHVPGISEAEFWSRYFTSQLWERHRASVRKSANDEVSKRKDDIFDMYLEEPDWNLQPRSAQPENIERFLDLSATEEDHGEGSTVRDFTMQAGRERSSLPLIRRFNDHSKKLLQAGEKGKRSALSTSTLPEDIDIYNEIDLEDLRGPAAASTIALDVQDKEDATNGDKSEVVRGILPGRSEDELKSMAVDQTAKIRSLHVDFSEVSLPTPPGGWSQSQAESGGSREQAEQYERFAAQREGANFAMLVVKELHTASNTENAVNSVIPDQVLEQMRSCHNAATEFLRQYWSAVLPTPAGALGAGTPSTSPAVKAARAAKMAGYLRSTESKVNAVISTAILAGVDPARIRKAMAPTVGAVEIALKREERRVVNGSA